jgi:ubiquinone/menaquinone biosynthesis C-methylase UbiE
MRVANRRPSLAVIEALGIQPSDRVLDIGCGDGSMIAAMPPTAYTCGLDSSRTMIEAARMRNQTVVASGRVSLIHGDMMELPFGRNSFDKIAASNVLYFCRDVPALIHECQRIAAPGATLVLYVTAADSMRHWGFAGHTTHRHFSSLQLEQELAHAGVGSEAFRIDRFSLPGRIEGLLARVTLNSSDPPDAESRRHAGDGRPREQ